MEFDRGIVNQMTGRVGTLQKKGYKSSILSELILFHASILANENELNSTIGYTHWLGQNDMHYYAKGQCQPIEKRQN